ncbi:MAG: hypothetical protein NXI21_01695 [Alphaproteobacteria bacterium]|nr:hypothetical protein [Alphaproteobacteria bacterium]
MTEPSRQEAAIGEAPESALNGVLEEYRVRLEDIAYRIMEAEAHARRCESLAVAGALDGLDGALDRIKTLHAAALIMARGID